MDIVHSQVAVTEEFIGNYYQNWVDPDFQQINTNQNEVLSAFELIKKYENDKYISGIRLYFKNQFTNLETPILIGGTKNVLNQTYNWTEKQSVAGKKVTKVYFCNNSDTVFKTVGLWFYLQDGTIVKNPQNFNQCDTANSIEIGSTDFIGTIRGLSLKRIPCGDIDMDYCMLGTQWKIFIDNNPCSLTEIPAQPVTLPYVTIRVMDSPKEYDWSALFTNTYAYTQLDSSACGTNYQFSLEDTESQPSFLSFSGSKIIGQTNSSLDVGFYICKLVVTLQPFAIYKVNFQVEVGVCVVEPPSFTQFSYTFEVGITSQPFDIAFTQPALCTDTAVLTSDPTDQSAWLSLVASSTTGGTLRIQGATLQQVGNYTLTITNSPSQMWTIVSLLIKDPCKEAVFELSPNPFSTITVDWTITGNEERAFKVYTQKERLNSSVICPIIATKTSLYADVPFVTISEDYSKIIVAAPLQASDIGSHNIQLRVDSSNNASNVLDAFFDFQVVVNCIVKTLTISTTVSDFNYILNAGAVTKGPFTVVQSPNCQFPVTWTNTQYSNNVLVGPATNFNTSTTQFTFSFTNPAQISTVQKFVLNVSISQTENGTTQQKDANYTLLVTIQPDCLNTSFVDKNLDMTISVGGQHTQSIFLGDTTATFHSQENMCGGRQYTFSTALPPYLLYDINSYNLTLKTTDAAHTGSHTATFTVTLTSYTSVTFTKTINLTITCTVETLSFSANPSPMTVEPGVPGSQPLTQASTVIKSPNCVQTVTFSLLNQPTFVSLTTNADTAFVKAEGAIVADQNIYSFKLRAIIDGKFLDQDFQVQVSDPCKRAIFDANSPLTNMQLIRDFDPEKTQNIVPKTDIETEYGLVCSFQAQLLSPPTFVTLTQTVITVSASETTAQDVDQYTISVLVKSALYPTFVVEKIYTFTLDVKHCVVNVMSSPDIVSLTFVIVSQPKTQHFIGATWSDLGCFYSVNYSVTLMGQQTMYAWITINEINQTITINANSPQYIGLHNLTLTATIPQPSDASGIKQTSVNFQVSISSDCGTTQFVAREIPGMLTKLMQAPIDQNIFVEDRKAVSYAQPGYCGQRTYTLTPAHAFLTINGDTLTLESTNVSEVGDYVVSLQVKLADYPAVQAFQTTFTAKVECQVLTFERITSPSITNKYRIKVDQPLLIPFQFTIIPSLTLNYSLDPALPFLALIAEPLTISSQTVESQIAFNSDQRLLRSMQNQSENKIKVETDDLKKSGKYQIKLFATTAAPCYGVSKITQFDLELVNLCESTVFYSQTIPDFKTFKEDPNFKPHQVIRFSNFNYDALQIHQLDCGPIKTQILSGTKTAPDWIELVDNNINLDFSGFQKPFKLKLDLVAYLAQYPDREITSSFQVSFDVSNLMCSPIMPQEYFLDSPALKFTIKFMNEVATFSPVVKAVAFDMLGKQIEVPYFVTFNEALSQFEISKITQKDFGQLFVGIQLEYKEYPGFSKICQTQLDLTYRPQFYGEAIALPKLICGQPWSVHIPIYTDYFGNPVLTTLNLGDAHFLSYSSATRNITTVQDTSNLASGFFSVDVTHTDSYYKSRTERLTFEVLSFKETKENYDQWKPNELPQKSPPRPYISEINQFGHVRVSFTKPISPPTFELYPEFKKETFMRSNCTNTTKPSDICVQSSIRRNLKQFDNKTADSIDIVNRGLVYVDGIFKPIINLKMIAGIESDENQLNMTWKCEDFQSKYMDFKINYTSFGNVSIHDNKDKIEVNILGIQYFRSIDKNQYIDQSVAVMERKVPPQLNPSLSDTFSAFNAAVGAVTKAVLVSQFLMNLFIGLALQELFSAIRKLTIMVHLLLINVRIPANAQVFFNKLLEFVNFQLIDSEPIFRRSFNLFETEEIDSKLLDLGYVSNYFIINMGNVLIMLIYLLALLVFFYFSKNWKNQRLLRIRDFLTNGLIWNTVLSFLTESYLLIVISTIINLRIFKFNSPGTGFSLILAIFSVIIIIGFPIFVLSFVIKHNRKLNWKNYRDKFGTLYECLNHKREGKKTLLEPFFTSMRILLLILALLLLKEYRYFQIFFSNFCMTFMIIYVGLSNCYVSKTMRFFEQFNEVFVAITNYHLMCFADFIQDERMRTLVGWSLIYCIGFNLIVNLSFIMTNSIKDAFIKLRKAYYKAKLKRLKKRAAQRHTQDLAQINQNQSVFKNQRIQVFRNRPIHFEIDQVIKAQPNQERENSLAHLVSEISVPKKQQKNKQQTPVKMQISNVLLKPTPLPGQIPFKPRKQAKLKKKVIIQPKIVHQDLEEEKTPSSMMKQSNNAIDIESSFNQYSLIDSQGPAAFWNLKHLPSIKKRNNIDKELEKIKNLDQLRNKQKAFNDLVFETGFMTRNTNEIQQNNQPKPHNFDWEQTFHSCPNPYLSGIAARSRELNSQFNRQFEQQVILERKYSKYSKNKERL